MDDFLETEKTFNQRKKEMLYQNWLKNVFNPMHSKLSEVMKGSMFKEYENKKRALFEKYLQYRNKKVRSVCFIRMLNIVTILHIGLCIP